MKTTKWLKIIFIVLTLLLTVIGVINYIIDPLWTFSHTNRFNSVQKGFNERQQKINKLYFGGVEKYDTLMLGSSRTTYINQYDFKNMHVFNMGAGNMFPREYKGYIDVLKQLKGKDFKNIIIGMDFFGSRIPEKSMQNKKAFYYFNICKAFMYRFKMMLSFDTLKYSLINIRNSYEKPTHYYTRDNVRKHKIASDSQRKHAFKVVLEAHKGVFTKVYQYNSNLQNILTKIKKENPNSNFIIFTTPSSALLLKTTLKECNRFKDYSRWLKDIITVFGKVYHFYYFNSVTMNEKNYFDDEHYYPYVGTKIAQILSQQPESNISGDFGIILTKDNLDEFLNSLKKKLGI